MQTQRQSQRLLLICSPGYYDNANTCQQCDSNCFECTGSSQSCTSCKAYNWLTSYKSCAVICSQYQFQVGLQCQSCDNSCKTCSGANSNQCTYCYKGFYLTDQGYCLPNCQPNEYWEVSSKKCLQCPNYCSTCSNNNTCLSCIPGFSLQTNLCKIQCPVGTYQVDNNVCLPCHPNCNECAAYPTCTICKQPDAKVVEENCAKSASGSDPFNYYAGYVQNTSQQCDSNCQSCTGSTDRNCTKCHNRFYKNGDICQPCSQDCYQCQDYSSYCILCPIFKRPKQNTCGENQQPCAAKQYLSVNSICTPCHWTCLTCLNDGSGSNLAQSNSLTCLQCDSGLGYENFNGFCVESYNQKNSTGCYQDKYYDPITQTCKPCHSSCIGCTGPNNYQCLGCIGTNQLLRGNCLSTAEVAAANTFI